ncbi:SGNH/GDSL hydrolase family protein [Flavihumibacter rivuli]|uniref:SGNH/GDSL hydrolase family protein n=1 Tax=Flavihumibacter rivuli TaxID=2838156 RepID=UPI001BDF4B41|nr:SGNH/GDSL hydrolase family protein [Flavihumibacter rivuli]ULQ57555.1 SGNH/GDSL hydrolase family protein [Flavihumibacter rivuli]
MELLNYLALGDSYTIGEQVPIYDSFPYQTVQILRKAGQPVAAPEIVARTGWTSFELRDGIAATSLLPRYDLVSLLVGVNNQYRGLSVDDYAIQFEDLLQQAIAFAGEKKERVVVLSIPDWGVTPFADDRDRYAIAREIDQFNAVNKAITVANGVAYIDITPGTREAAHDNRLLAGDGLHPSGREYARWAERLSLHFLGALEK